MSSEIKVGSTGVLTTVVQSGNTIVLGDDKSAEVFSTPSMINLMEYAARKALQPFLKTGEESVGIDVRVNHLSATPPRNEVRAVATITEVDKNVISFELEAHDAWEKIGAGTHRRAIVQTAKISEKVSSKRNLDLAKDASHSPSKYDIPSIENRDQPKIDLRSVDLSALQYFKIEINERRMHIVLNRAKKKNAICEGMTHELALLVEWLSQNSDRISVVIFSGDGDNFSTGDDVSELDPNDPNRMQELSLLRGAVYARLANLPQVTIAAIDGYALGGGFVFVAACDFRIATYNAKVGLPEAKLGWPPNYGVEIIRSSLGRSLAIQWSSTGELISAKSAKAAGFIQQVVVGNQLVSAAKTQADKILANGPAAVAAVKKVLPLDAKNSDSLATEEFLKCLQSDHAKKSFERFL